MTEPGTLRRLRSRRIALAAAGIGAAVIAAGTVVAPTETIAAFTDNVWASAGFGAGSFGVESSSAWDGDYKNHSESPLVLNFDTPITLTPGEVAYAGFYIKRTSGTDDYADVTVSGPVSEPDIEKALWSSHLTFLAKAAPAPSADTVCDANIHDVSSEWEPLYNSGSFASPQQPAPDAGFRLGEGSTEFTDGEPYMVCFEFTLDPNVVTAAPEANGESVNPTWTFTAESVPQP